MIARAFRAMTAGRPRPAAIFLPQDLMRQPCTEVDLLPALELPAQPAVPRTEVLQAAELLEGGSPANHSGRGRRSLVRGRR